MKTKKFLLIRILGNDLNGIHGNNQTINNLQFTLENEYTFNNTKKMFVLNRIISKDKKKEIITMLTKYNIEYIDIPFDINIFRKLPNNIPSFSDYKKYNKKSLVKTLYKHNLYLINNNGCRNFCITYGKRNGYTWTFVLDSNSFFTKESFTNIITNIDSNTKYIVVPQKRLKDGNLDNSILLSNNYSKKIYNLPEQEPQVAFSNSSTITFNPNIPYGIAPKAELLYALQVPGKWCNWMNFYGLPIKPRKYNNIPYKKVSYIIRLHPYSSINNVVNNWKLRWFGLYLLVRNIEKNI